MSWSHICSSFTFYLCNYFFYRSSPSPSDHVIFPAEAEAFVQELRPTSVGEVGGER